MAEEVVQVLRIDTGDSVTTIGELKQYIRDLKSALDETQVGTEEYEETLEELTTQQTALKAAMAGSADAYKQIQEGVEGNVKSYNELTATMAELKAAWRATTDETERGQIGAQIAELNQQLKDLDASTGNFQRNVGDYANQMQKGFMATAGSAGKVIQPLKNVKGAMMAVSSTPLVAILGAIVSVIMNVIEKLKSSEESMNAMSEAMAGFSVIGDVITKILQGLGKVIAFVVEALGTMVSALFGVNEATQEHIRLARMEKQLMEDEREAIMRNAEAELESAKLRAEAADKLNYSAEERIKKLKQAGELERQISERNMNNAQLEYEIIKRKNALTESSTEELNAEADAYAKMLQAQTAYFNKTKEINAQLNEAKNQQRSEEQKAAQEALKIRQEAITKENELLALQIGNLKTWTKEYGKLKMEQVEKETAQEIEKAKAEIRNQEVLNETIIELEKQKERKLKDIANNVNLARIQIYRQNNLNAQMLTKKGSEEQLKLNLDLMNFEESVLLQKQDETDAAFTARRIKVMQERDEVEQAYLDKKYEDERNAFLMALEWDEGDPNIALKERLAEAQYDYENMFRGVTETEEEFNNRRLELEKAHQDAKAELEQNYVDPFALSLEQELEQLEQDSTAYLEKELELKKYELDTIHKYAEESDDEFYKRQLKLEQEYNNSKKKLSQARTSMAMSFVSATSSLVTSLAAIYESDTDASEEELQKAKNLKIAGAIMSTIEGAVGAYMNASKAYTPPYGQILGAISAATVLASGYANVRQIQQTDVSANSSSSITASAGAMPSSATSVQAPTMDTTIESIRTITTASEEEALNKSQKVYLVTDELEIAQNSKKVRVNEATF